MWTVSRARLPRTHSYPVGLEQLAKAIDREQDRIGVVFECYPVALQTLAHPYRLMTFTPIGEGVTELKVAAVRRDLKSLLRDLILSDSTIQALQAGRNLTLGTRVEFYFDEANSTLIGPRLVGAPEVPALRKI